MRISKVLFTLFFALFAAQETEMKKTEITGDMEENRNQQMKMMKKKSALEEIIAKRNDFLKNLEVFFCE